VLVAHACILATQEADMRIEIRSQPGQIVHVILSRKTLHKNIAGGVAQGEGSEFKPQYLGRKKRGLHFCSLGVIHRLRVIELARFLEIILD
jgi:hypothetical protein